MGNCGVYKSPKGCSPVSKGRTVGLCGWCPPGCLTSSGWATTGSEWGLAGGGCGPVNSGWGPTSSGWGLIGNVWSPFNCCCRPQLTTTVSRRLLGGASLKRCIWCQGYLVFILDMVLSVVSSVSVAVVIEALSLWELLGLVVYFWHHMGRPVVIWGPGTSSVWGGWKCCGIIWFGVKD